MSFFKKHQKTLEAHYPGITERILLSELKGIDLESIKSDLLRGRPLNYISKSRYFFNREFYVEEGVLIPRYETEMLVEEGLKFLKDKPKASVLDLCCGSGNIGLALFEEMPSIQLTLSDLSIKATTITQKNANSRNVQIIQSDLFTCINNTFDLIISNPPYIPTDKKDLVHQGVDGFEPHEALYVENNDYDAWFKNLFSQTFDHLNPGGLFLMEGHEDHLLAQSQILKTLNFKNVGVLKDLTGRDRFLKGSKNE